MERTFVTTTDTAFTDLTLTTGDGRQVITSTQNHPYYDVTRDAFVDASLLSAGDRLQTTGQQVAVVAEVRNFTDSMVTYDLTVSGLHTYFVATDGTPVLVHNTGCKEVALDANSLIAAVFEGRGAAIDAALAGRAPVISPGYREATDEDMERFDW